MPLVAVGGSLIGGLLASHAAGKAANAQAGAANQAGALIQNNANKALGQQSTALGNEQSNLAPYTQAGTTALSNLGAMQPFSAPTAAQAEATPGYQFQLQQGEKALQNSAAARGGLLSGGTAKAINDYAQGQASTNYGNTYNQALQAYQTNFGNQFGLANLGANSANSLSNFQQGNANAQSSILGNSAAEQAQQINNAGAARASGYAAQGNILGGLASGLGQYGSDQISLQNLNASQYPSGYNAGGGAGQIYGNDITGLHS